MKSATVFTIIVLACGSMIAGAQGPAASAPASQPSTSVVFEGVIHDIDLRRPVPERLVVNLRVTPDPSLHVSSMQRLVTADKAVDDQGNSLLLEGPIPADLNPDSATYGSAVISDIVRVILQPPAAEATPGSVIQSLDGVISGAVAAGRETVEMSAPQTEKRTYAGGVKGTFTTTMTNANTIKVEYAFDIPADLPDFQHQAWISQMIGLGVKIVDDSGAAWRQSGGGSSVGGSTHFGATNSYSAPAGTSPAGPPRVTFTVIAETKPIKIPFHIVNIPLP